MTHNADKPAVPPGYWMSATGSLVPIAKVKPIDKERDKLVRHLMGQACELNSTLAEFKVHVMSLIHEFVKRSAQEYGKTIGGAKGGLVLNSYDGSMRVLVQVADTIGFDERLQVAKQIFDDVAIRWGRTARGEVKAILNLAFKTNRSGQLSVARVLELRKINSDDPDWQTAMKIVNDSIQVVSSKPYVRFYVRDEAGQYRPLPIDIAAV